MGARVFWALVRRDLRCALHTPSVVAMVAFGVATVALLFSQVDWIGEGLWDGTFGTWVFAYAYSVAPILAACIPAIDAPPVERSAGEYATLLRAGVRPDAIAASKLVASLALAAGSTLLHLLPFGFDPLRLAALIALVVPGQLPLQLFSVSLGLTGRAIHDNSAGTFFVSCAAAFAPVTIIGLEPFASACTLLPNASSVLAGTFVATGAAPTWGWLLVGGAYVAWLVMMGAVFGRALRRFSRELRETA